MSGATSPDRGGVSRRALVRGGVLGGMGAAGLAAGIATAGRAAEPPVPPAGDLVVPFHGQVQSGILDDPQPHASFVALDLDEGVGRDGLGALMRLWSDDIGRLMSGRAPLTDQEPELAARTAGLSVTVGWGTTLPSKVGLEAPPWLRPVPPMPIDELDDSWGEADLVLVLAAYSPLTVAHARTRLVGAARGLASLRWVQDGFREPMEREGWSMRNQFGQVDGTVQPDVQEDLDRPLVVRSADADPAWAGGSSLVLRRIRMDLEGWERADRLAREHAIGRDLRTGAPLTGGTEHTPVDLHATLPNGLPVIDGAAHVRRASPEAPHERFLRRPYMYEQVTGDVVESGLLFAAYQADPVRQFVPVQERLAEADLLNLWTIPVGSAVFALLPGVPEGGWLGQTLLA